MPTSVEYSVPVDSTSGENLFVVLLMMAPPSQELEPPANPGRFIAADDADANKDQTNLTYTIVSQPTKGSVALSGATNNGFTFNPGTAFDYLAKDQPTQVTFT